MTDKHTPEPWYVGVDKGYGGCPDITVCSSSGPVISSSVDICGSSYVEITEEDAHRIVACVNACKGIPTELLEDLGVGGVMATHFFRLGRFMKVVFGKASAWRLLC